MRCQCEHESHYTIGARACALCGKGQSHRLGGLVPATMVLGPHRSYAHLSCLLKKMSRQRNVARERREPENCDSCGERVGYYDPKLPEGEKIVINRDCECVRADRAAGSGR